MEEYLIRPTLNSMYTWKMKCDSWHRLPWIPKLEHKKMHGYRCVQKSEQKERYKRNLAINTQEYIYTLNTHTHIYICTHVWKHTRSLRSHPAVANKFMFGIHRQDLTAPWCLYDSANEKSRGEKTWTVLLVVHPVVHSPCP